MVESALNVAAEMVLEYTQNGVELRRDGNRGPGASPQGVYRCRGDDDWLALALIDDAAWRRLAELIGVAGFGRDAGLATEAVRRVRADEIDKLLGDWTAQRTVEDAVRDLRRCGVAAAPVVAPHTLLSDEQLMARGFWETVDHPVVGQYLCTGMPFTFRHRPRRWIRIPPPLYGQHTDEVLAEVLGVSEDDRRALQSAGVTSERPAGV